MLQDGQQLPELAVSEGYLKLREDAGKREENEENIAVIERLKELEAKARSENKGVWATSGDKIHTSYELTDPQAFVQRVKGQPLASTLR